MKHLIKIPCIFLCLVLLSFSPAKAGQKNLPSAIIITSCYQYFTNIPGQIGAFNILENVPVTITSDHPIPYFVVYNLTYGYQFTVDYGVPYIFPTGADYRIIIPTDGAPGSFVWPVDITSAPFEFNLVPYEQCVKFGPFFINMVTNMKGLCSVEWSVENPVSGAVYKPHPSGLDYHLDINSEGYCDLPPGADIIGIRCKTLNLKYKIKSCAVDACPDIDFVKPISVCCECTYTPIISERVQQPAQPGHQHGPKNIAASGAAHEVTVYPNPFSSHIVAHCATQDVVAVVLKDITGKTIMKAEGNTLETAMLNSGIYILESTLSTGETIQNKVVK